ncbi:MAG: hypothetical protein C1943_09675 [Halochromatium sp.]|nr:hypothetical protein [Halochromatium sp.]
MSTQSAPATATATATAAESTVLPPGLRRSMVLLTALMISVMAVIDMTIVSVALPYMAGNLSASPYEITWVVTMFTCGQALIIGVSGHLTRLLGRRRLALIVVTGFVLSSLACGLSQTLTQIVIFRFIQGLFSGPLIPLSQSMLIDAFPPQERSKALSIWVLGVLGGPALGPVIGGFLAQNLDWRWNFWVNLPIGLVALMLILSVMPRTAAQRVRTDLAGFVLLAVWVVCLQIMLDQGDDLDWLGSAEIWVLGILTLTFFIAFVLRGVLIGDRNIMRFRLFADVNFLACSVLVALFGVLFLGSFIITPELAINYLQWEVVTVGLIMGAAGGFGVVAALLASHIERLIGIRQVAVLAALCIAAGWFAYSRLSPATGPAELLVPLALNLFGLMLIYPLLAAQAFQNLRPEDRDEGAALFNFLKNLGFSLGTTFVGVMLYRGNQGNWSRYVGDLSWSHPGFMQWLEGPVLDEQLPLTMALVSDVLTRQVGILTILQLCEVLAVLAILTIPLAFLLKRRVS